MDGVKGSSICSISSIPNLLWLSAGGRPAAGSPPATLPWFQGESWSRHARPAVVVAFDAPMGRGHYQVPLQVQPPIPRQIPEQAQHEKFVSITFVFPPEVLYPTCSLEQGPPALQSLVTSSADEKRTIRGVARGAGELVRRHERINPVGQARGNPGGTKEWQRRMAGSGPPPGRSGRLRDGGSDAVWREYCAYGF